MLPSHNLMIECYYDLIQGQNSIFFNSLQNNRWVFRRSKLTGLIKKSKSCIKADSKWNMHLFNSLFLYLIIDNNWYTNKYIFFISTKKSDLKTIYPKESKDKSVSTLTFDFKHKIGSEFFKKISSQLIILTGFHFWPK